MLVKRRDDSVHAGHRRGCDRVNGGRRGQDHQQLPERRARGGDSAGPLRIGSGSAPDVSPGTSSRVWARRPRAHVGGAPSSHRSARQLGRNAGLSCGRSRALEVLDVGAEHRRQGSAFQAPPNMRPMKKLFNHGGLPSARVRGGSPRGLCAAGQVDRVHVRAALPGSGLRDARALRITRDSA